MLFKIMRWWIQAFDFKLRREEVQPSAPSPTFPCRFQRVNFNAQPQMNPNLVLPTAGQQAVKNPTFKLDARN